jgi:ABC-2 type transport system permease protein
MEAMRTLVLQDLEWSVIGRGFLVVAGASTLMVLLSVRSIHRYD